MPELKPKAGDLRAWSIINVPGQVIRYPVKNEWHAAMLIEALATSQLLDDSIHSNAFGLEAFRNDGWEEWNDEDGNDIRDWAEIHLPNVELLVKAAQNIVHFINQFDRMPLRKTPDEFYGIHNGTKFEAKLKLSEFRKIREAVKAPMPLPTYES